MASISCELQAFHIYVQSTHSVGWVELWERDRSATNGLQYKTLHTVNPPRQQAAGPNGALLFCKCVRQTWTRRPRSMPACARATAWGYAVADLFRLSLDAVCRVHPQLPSASWLHSTPLVSPKPCHGFPVCWIASRITACVLSGIAVCSANLLPQCSATQRRRARSRLCATAVAPEGSEHPWQLCGTPVHSHPPCFPMCNARQALGKPAPRTAQKRSRKRTSSWPLRRTGPAGVAFNGNTWTGTDAVL